MANNITRDSPNKERTACDKIIQLINNELPRGGASMIIGTPIAFCVSRMSSNNMLLTDNMEVAVALKFTTDVLPTIVIGDLIDPVKAHKKSADWRSNNSTSNFTIIVDGVDRNGSDTENISVL